MKFDDTPSREEREDFWLDLGPASAYEGLDCCETARRDGDASPDGLAHGFEGAESPKDLVAPPDDDPDSEPVPHLPPQLKALEWLATPASSIPLWSIWQGRSAARKRLQRKEGALSMSGEHHALLIEGTDRCRP